MTSLLPSLNSPSPNMQKSVTLQRSVDKKFGNASFVTEYVDEYTKKQARKAKHAIYDKRSGNKPEWLEKIENAPAPKIDDEALLNTRKASLFKEEYPEWKGARPTESIQIQLRDEEYDKIRRDAGKTKMKTVSSYDDSVNATARKWRPGKGFDREANINTMSSYQNPTGRGAKMLYKTSKAQSDYPHWGSSAFPDRAAAPESTRKQLAKFNGESEYKGHFRNSGYGAPRLRKADRAVPPTMAPLQNETTYTAAFTKDEGNAAPQYGTLAAREILERRNWHTSPMPLAPDEKRRGQERTKIQWSGKKKGYTIYKGNKSPYFSVDTQGIDDLTTYRDMTSYGPRAALQQPFVKPRTREVANQILSDTVNSF